MTLATMRGTIRNGALPPLACCTSAPLAAAQDWREGVGSSSRDNPCLIRWERTLADALARSTRTGMPLLVCVNMDEEAASEVFAHRKYKDAAFAALAAASPSCHRIASS